MTINISFVAPEHRPVALRLLFARFPVQEQQTRMTDAIQSAERGGLNLDGLLLAEENGQPVGAALSMHQTDGVTLVWPPVITCQTANGPLVEDKLMKRLCEEIDSAGSRLAQVLLAPDDAAEIELLGKHGFEHLADMFFLARALTPNDVTGTINDREFNFDGVDLANHTDRDSHFQATDDFVHELFNEANSERFVSVIERTYQQSLDCPFLDGFRSGKDAIVSHRLSGRFDPASWRIYRIDSQDAGVLLMNEHPDQDAIELVYFGIVPEFRGRGLGRRVLSDGVQAAALTNRAVLFLAVDCGNTYANALYGELGFAELARRRVMVRRSSQMARE